MNRSKRVMRRRDLREYIVREVAGRTVLKDGTEIRRTLPHDESHEIATNILSKIPHHGRSSKIERFICVTPVGVEEG